MLACSWMTQSSLVTPASLNFSPAPWPATVSVWPTWVIAPNSLYTSAPELIVITGMPASTALATASFERVRVGERHDEPVDARGDGGLDELRLLLRVVVGTLVVDA